MTVTLMLTVTIKHETIPVANTIIGTNIGTINADGDVLIWKRPRQDNEDGTGEKGAK